MTGNRFGCDFPGCTAHPRFGDLIVRTSPKGGPFVGRCKRHLGQKLDCECDQRCPHCRNKCLGGHTGWHWCAEGHHWDAP
jgi:hypothetical protein